MRTIDWVDGAVEIIDQTALPGETRVLRLSTVDELVAAVRTLAVRGAPALGVAGALGVALAARQFADDEDALASAVHLIKTARPTAVNLARGAQRAADLLPAGPDAVLKEALRVRDEEIESADAMARLGAALVVDLCGERPRLLTHCNTGALATVVGGTALAVAFELHRRGQLTGVIASETRPLLQGARLTAWELGRAGISYRVAVDGAGPFLMARGEVDAVIVGADRICANGDVINKVGTYAHALGRGRDRGSGPGGGGVAGRARGRRRGQPGLRCHPARPGDRDRHRPPGDPPGPRRPPLLTERSPRRPVTPAGPP